MEIKTVETELLDIDYLENGPLDGDVVLLLHGWPDDATTWDSVSTQLAKNGYRTIAPWLRGCGGTSFRSASTLRTGNSGILAFDAIALLNALDIEKVSVIGHDWGSNIAEALAVGWPERITRIAQLSSPPRLGGQPTPPFHHTQLEWYHWFQATQRGADAIRKEPLSFAQIMWDNWSPMGWYEDATFNQVSES